MTQLDLQQKLDSALEEVAYYKPKYWESQKAVGIHLQTIQKLENERDALQQQVNALAVENLNIKDLYKEVVKELDDTCFEIGMMRGEKSMEYAVPENPATDAIKRQWMAEGVDEFGKYHNFSEKLFIQKEAVKFSAKLRQPEEKGQ